MSSDDIPLPALLGIFFLLLALSAFFSGTETALMRVNRYKLRHRAREGHRGALLAERLLSRPDRLLGLILFGNNLVNFFAAFIWTVLALRVGGMMGAVAGTILLTLIVLVVAEITPKTWAAARPEKLALVASRIYFPLQRLLGPIVWSVNLIAGFLVRLTGVRPDRDEGQDLTVAELRTLVTESGGRIPNRRRQMLLAVLELEALTIEDIMTPRGEIEGIDLEAEWPEVVRQLRSSSHSVLPCYRGQLDNVAGMLHVRKLFQANGSNGLNRRRLERFLESPHYVFEHTSLTRMFSDFHRGGGATSLVVDEYGDIQGLVSVQDLLHEISGGLIGDSSQDAEEDEVQPDGNGGWLVDAGANIRLLNRRMSWRLPTYGPKTLNGLILDKLGTIPEQGQRLELGGFPMEILETTESAVDRVRVTRAANPDNSVETATQTGP
ncbi:MAG: CNNM domain-containing protein [Gammaproteobacteria bacterium]|nr:CNNM domain-containing protein [Gammaproteobacteria bacterium]